MGNVPWFWPGVLISIIVGFVAARRLAQALGIRPPHAAVLVISFGVILAATLTPLRDAIVSGAVGSGVCDLSRFGPPPLRELVRLNDTTLNLVLFAPLGVAIGLLPRARHRAVFLLLAAILPFGIEVTQILAPVLDRGCQSADVVDNLTGLAGGFIAATLWRRVGAARIRRPPPEIGSRRDR